MSSSQPNISKTPFNRGGFAKYFKNTIWLFLTYGLRLFTGFFVGLWLARYLGPEDYGIYNYVISLTTIFITIATFGTTEILVKKILHSTEDSQVALKSGFDLRLFLSLALFLVLGIYAYLFEESREIQVFILISAFALFFQPFEVVDSFFRAKVQVQKSSLGRMAQLTISSLLKIALIIYRSPLQWFYFVFVFDAIFYASIVLLAYLKENKNFLSRHFSKSLMKEIGNESFPLMIVAVSSLMLSRFDQVMIGKILTKVDVGFYSAASKTIEIGTLFSVLVSMSLYPAILNSKKTDHANYLKRMAMLNRLLVWGGITLTGIVFFYSELVIRILFGEKYLSSQQVLKLLSLNIMFISFYQVSYRWYLSENLQKLMMYKVLAAVMVNVGLNFLLIPRYGIMGAAYGSVTTSLIFHFFFEALFKQTRECFRINTSFLHFS